MRLSCSDSLIYTGQHTFQRHSSPPLAVADGVDSTLVRSPGEDFFQKSSGQILPSGPLRNPLLTQRAGFFLSLSSFSKTQPNHWTKEMTSTQLVTSYKGLSVFPAFIFSRQNTLTKNYHRSVSGTNSFPYSKNFTPVRFPGLLSLYMFC